MQIGKLHTHFIFPGINMGKMGTLDKVVILPLLGSHGLIT